MNIFLKVIAFATIAICTSAYAGSERYLDEINFRINQYQMAGHRNEQGGSYAERQYEIAKRVGSTSGQAIASGAGIGSYTRALWNNENAVFFATCKDALNGRASHNTIEGNWRMASITQKGGISIDRNIPIRFDGQYFRFASVGMPGIRNGSQYTFSVAGDRTARRYELVNVNNEYLVGYPSTTDLATQQVARARVYFAREDMWKSGFNMEMEKQKQWFNDAMRRTQ